MYRVEFIYLYCKANMCVGSILNIEVRDKNGKDNYYIM